MIVSIVHKGLRLLWENGDPSRLPQNQVKKIREVLTMLNRARDPELLRKISGYKLHQLTGNRKGYWSVTVSRNYRIIFRFEDENVHLVDYLDYH